MNMKVLSWGLVGLAMVVLTNTTWAQRGMGFGRNSLSGILGMEEVQKELKLDGETLEKVQAFVDESRTATREKFTELRDEGLERDEMMAEFQKFQASMAEKEAKTLGELLSPEQMKRANQLLVQSIGLSAVTRADVAAAIGLSDESVSEMKSKIAELDQKRNEKLNEARENQDPDAMQDIQREYRTNVDELVNSTLSDEQKKAFEEYKGAAFTFPEPQQGGGRRRSDF